MSLDVAKLEKVRELAGGIVQARCPACAEGGNDRKGEHLRIYPDGKFGCCVHPKEGDHRKRIWALVGVRKPGNFSLRLKSPPAMSAATSVKAVLVMPRQPSPGFQPPSPVSTGEGLGTLGTEKGGLDSPSAIIAAPADLKTSESGTLGAAIVMLRACARVESTTANIDTGDFLERQRDFGSAVPAVPVVPPLSAAGERLPFLTAAGDLSIPFDSPERYHWWMPDGERMTVAETLAEVRAALATNERMNNAPII
ncbi:MAG: hypothetical protein WCH99_20015 [Verrucomicrobiota bacterium]